MRVIIINANWGGGGPGGIAADLYCVLTKAGHECRFAYARGKAPDDVSAYRIGTMLDVYVHTASARLFDNAGFMSGHATDGLIKEIERYRPDIISIHNPLGYTIHVEKLFNYIRASGIPTFWTIHDCWAATGHCITSLCGHWETGCGNCPNKGEYPKSILLDRSAKNLQRKIQCLSGIENLSFIAPSVWIKELLKKSYLGEYRFEVIHNGIDLEKFHPVESDLREQYGLTGKTILLGVAGKWTVNKGGSYLRKLADRLDDRYAVVMIGKGAEQYADEFGRMICLGPTDSIMQLAQWYTVADAFVNPTMGDNFPTVNLEALACGTPVVTFDTGGSGESVGECGAVVEAGNLNALYAAVMDCVTRKTPSEKCVKHAQLYNKLDRYKDYLELFQRKLAK